MTYTRQKQFSSRYKYKSYVYNSQIKLHRHQGVAHTDIRVRVRFAISRYAILQFPDVTDGAPTPAREGVRAASGANT